ncbi:MAG: hypothetical protein AAF202_01390 [Pseudomonadota bacterium]
MKKLIALIAIVASPLAMACPELTGTYRCYEQDGETNIFEMVTTVENGVYVYTTDGESIRADGRRHNFQNDETKGSYTAKCAGSSELRVNMKGQLLENGKRVGNFKMKINVKKTATGITERNKGNVTYMGQKFQIDENTSCDKI